MYQTLKTLGLIAGIFAIAFAANATTVTVDFTGSWDEMHTWNPGQVGAPTLSTTPGGGPEMSVAGQITYNRATGVVTALTMQQVGINTQNWDLNPDYPNTPQYDTVTMSNFAWTADGTNLRLDSGTVVCNGADRNACGPGYQFGGNYVGRGGPLEIFGPPVALTDWTGAENFDAYGDILDGPGFMVTSTGRSAAIHTVTSWDGFVALAATSTYNLELAAPLSEPGTLGLFGMSLGLIGWVRRRRS